MERQSNRMLKFMMAAAVCVASLNVFGQNVPDASVSAESSKHIWFKASYSIYNPDRMGNGATMDSVANAIFTASQYDPYYKVIITGATSPEGTYAKNAALAAKRAAVVADTLTGIVTAMGVEDFNSHVETRAIGEDWATLADIAENSDQEWGKEMARILRETPKYTFDSNGHVNGGIKEDIRNLRGGKAYNYMFDNWFDQLRYARIDLSYSIPAVEPILVETDATADTVKEEELVKVNEPEVIIPEHPVEREYYDWKFMALKTNLLFDLATAVNVEVEIPLGRRMSVNAEYIGPWWLFEADADQYCLQTNTMQFEGRYWFPRKNAKSVWADQPLNGFFAGIYGGTGKYDIEIKGQGKQGEFWNAGIGFGYSASITKHLNFEAEVGIGFLDTQYEAYRTRKNNTVLQYLETKHNQFMGYPTRAHASLVWNFYGKRLKK